MAFRFLNPWGLAEFVIGSGGKALQIEYSVNGVTLYASVPPYGSWTALKDVLVFEQYEWPANFKLSQLTRGSVVVDVGAFVGLFSMKAAVFAGRVVAIEPSVANYRTLEHNITRNRFGNVELWRAALWSSAGTSFLIDSGTRSHLSREGGYAVVTTTLEEVVRRVGRVDLLKMDIEGAEYETLSRSDEHTLNSIDKVAAEVHLNDDTEKQKLKLLVEKLERSGFIVKVFPAQFQSAYYGMVKPWKCRSKAV